MDTVTSLSGERSLDEEKDDGDGYALLALTKQRLAAAAIAADKQKEDKEEDVVDSVGKEQSKDDAPESDKVSSLSVEKDTKAKDTPVLDSTSSLAGSSANEEKKQGDEEDESRSSQPSSTSRPSPRRRDENAGALARVKIQSC